MESSRGEANATWLRLKSGTTEAVMALGEALAQPAENSQDLTDAYLYAKRRLAVSMQAYARSQLSTIGIETFFRMRDEVSLIVSARYSSFVPAKYLRIPYGSTVHSELFGLLFEHLGESVESSMLRVITADSVHTERRTRELREIGFDIDAGKSNGLDTYCLRSLHLDENMMSAIVKNNVKRDKDVSPSVEQQLLAKLI